MSTLYIIGNGFDLWHGLPTSYEKFNEYAKETLCDSELYFNIEAAEKGPWYDFENSLATFDWQSFYDAHDHTDINAENFRPSEAFGLEDDLIEQADDLVSAIKECFREWIEDIDISVASEKMKFESNAMFFTFNYTSTLQYIYGIDDANIFHIHGRSDRFDDLIFGHGEERDEEPELDESGDSNRTMFSDAEDAAKYPFYALKKPVIEVIEDNRKYFKNLDGISDIVVIGHSLNEIDLLYYRELSKNIVGCKWTVYIFSQKDRGHHKRQLLNCGVKLEDIDICTYDDMNQRILNSHNKQSQSDA